MIEPPIAQSSTPPVPAGSALRQLIGFVRVMIRFFSFAALLCAAELVRRYGAAWPLERRMVGAVMAFACSGVLGILILWRSREDAAREFLESAAIAGFWTGIFALIP